MFTAKFVKSCFATKTEKSYFLLYSVQKKIFHVEFAKLRFSSKIAGDLYKNIMNEQGKNAKE